MLVPLLRPAVLEVVGPSSEAGLRQTLGGDARPVVWDEARPEGRRGHVRFEEVMTYARHLSSGREAAVIKGGKDHQPRPFTGTGVLCLAARQLPPRPADRDRVTAVELAAGGRDDRRVAAALALLDEAFARGLVVRMVRLLPTLRASHEVFARTGDERRGPQPAGDQLGALLAGAWHLEHDRAPTAEEAAAQYRGLPDELVGPVRSRAAGERCLEVLARYRVGPGTAGAEQAGSLTMGELTGLALGGGGAGGGVGAKEAHAVLRRLGVLVLAEGREVAVTNKHRGLGAIFAGTDFAAGWGAAEAGLPAGGPHHEEAAVVRGRAEPGGGAAGRPHAEKEGRVPGRAAGVTGTITAGRARYTLCYGNSAAGSGTKGRA